MNNILIYTGAAVVVILLIIALYLHWRLYLLNKQIKQKQSKRPANPT